MKELIPSRIVKELDKYIVGQEDAKRCVAIAIRNRWRRQQLPEYMKEEVAPKNIIMIGPTGVGKTEIARRLSNLVKAPFIKVEASKYTEVGYHGRDVESMIRDLVEISVAHVREEHTLELQKKTKEVVEMRLLDLLLPDYDDDYDDDDAEENEDKCRFNNAFEDKNKQQNNNDNIFENSESANFRKIQNNESKKLAQERKAARKRAREKMLKKLRAGQLEEEMVEITTEDRAVPVIEVFSNAGMDQIGMDMQQMFERIAPSRQQNKKLKIKDARGILTKQESERLIDKEKVNRESIKRVENMGIVFIDEIDKVAANKHKHGPDISREGVQRDLLPIVEGSTIVTRYGMVKTDHILFISAGAFSISKPTDLIPELQGRFPIRVELNSLTSEHFVRILQEPKNALIKQYQALLKTEGVELEFKEDAIKEIAKICETVNQKMQNIGARRLHTILEKLLEDISFTAPELKTRKVVINSQQVQEKLADIVEDEDLSKYIL